MKVRDIMTTDPFVITRNEPIWRAAEIMRDIDVGIVPVVDDAASLHVLGVITDRDIAVRCVAKKHGMSCSVGDHMTTNLGTVHPDDDVDAVISLMEREQVRRVPVVSESNRLAGMISQADLALKVGPNRPTKVEAVLQHVSTPRKVPTA
jgi:CBS domain-containing protein